jgi:hypothetical protein
MLIPDYDASDAAPISKVQGMAYRNAARAQAWLSFCQDSIGEDLNKQKSYFVRQGTAPTGSDIKLYDVANLFLCVQGSDTNTVGELWVEYDVSLMTPALQNDSLAAGLIGFTGVTDLLIFGTITNPGKVGRLDITATGNTITFNQAWTGLVLYELTGTVVTVPVLSGTVLNRSVQSSIINAAGTIVWLNVFVNALPGQTLIADASAAASIGSSIVFLSQYD